MRGRLASVAVAAMLFTLLPTTIAFAVAPGNDSFAGATPVTDLPFEETLDVLEATVESGEELSTCAPFANTVWYALNLEGGTDVFVDSAGSDYDTAIAVWTGGELADLSLMACVDDTATSLQSAVRFTAEAGVTYFVQVGAFDSIWEGSTLHLSIDETPKATGKPEIYKWDYSGKSAGAYMDHYDETTGTYSYAELYVGENREKQFQGKPYRSAYLWFYAYESSYDPVTEEYTWTTVYGDMELAPGALHVNSQIRSGNVTAEITVTGETCTQSPSEPDGQGNYWYITVCTEIGPEPALVDMVWTASGAAYKSRYMDRSSSEGMRSSYRGVYTSRNATVAGGVSSASVEYDFSGAYGHLSRDSSASMTVVRGPY